MRILRRKVAKVFEPLLEPAPYKGAYGGRASGKSHFFAEQLIEDALAEPGNSAGEGLRAICIREVQRDLTQSSKHLIEQKLAAFGLSERDGFKIYQERIATPGDGVIIFKGMRDYTADSIKSLEGFKRAWWEEAHTATMHSINLLRPTLRAPGAERWFSWNPTRNTDAVELLLRGPLLPSGAIVVRANWRDNPFWNDEIERERQDFLRTQPELYPHVWEGEYARVLSGAYYAKHIAEAREQHRIGRVAADPLMTIRLFVDIGGTGARADAFAMWAMQFVGREIRALDYYEAVGQPLARHLEWMRARGYTPQRAQIWLPHDGDSNDKVYDVSYASALRGAGYEVTVVPNQGKGAAMKRIEAARRWFSSIWFNAPDDVQLTPEGWYEQPTCAAGIDALGWYHEKRDETRGIGLGPEHDWSSHAADSFGLACVCAERIFGEIGRAPVELNFGSQFEHGLGHGGSIALQW